MVFTIFTVYIRPRIFLYVFSYCFIKKAWVFCCAKIPCILITISFSIFATSCPSHVIMCLLFSSSSWSLWRMIISWLGLEFSVDVNSQTGYEAICRRFKRFLYWNRREHQFGFIGQSLDFGFKQRIYWTIFKVYWK